MIAECLMYGAIGLWLLWGVSLLVQAIRRDREHKNSQFNRRRRWS